MASEIGKGHPLVKFLFLPDWLGSLSTMEMSPLGSTVFFMVYRMDAHFGFNFRELSRESVQV